MPRSWLCFVALLLPLGFSLMVLHTDFVNQLWYDRHYEAYTLLSALRMQPMFLQFMGGWPLPLFIAVVFFRWVLDEDDDTIPGQLLVLPIIYLPFTILGHWFSTGQFHPDDLYVHPLVILSVGYAYVLVWELFIWVMAKLRLVL